MAGRPRKEAVASTDDVTTALIAYMIDEGVERLHISRGAAGEAIIDGGQELWLSVEKSRDGIVVALHDRSADLKPVTEAYRPPASVQSFGSIQNEAQPTPDDDWIPGDDS